MSAVFVNSSGKPVQFSLYGLIDDVVVYERVGSLTIQHGGAVTPQSPANVMNTQTVCLDLRQPLSDHSPTSDGGTNPHCGTFHYSYVERCVKARTMIDPRPYRVQVSSAIADRAAILRVLLDTWTWSDLLQQKKEERRLRESAEDAGDPENEDVSVPVLSYNTPPSSPIDASYHDTVTSPMLERTASPDCSRSAVTGTCLDLSALLVEFMASEKAGCSLPVTGQRYWRRVHRYLPDSLRHYPPRSLFSYFMTHVAPQLASLETRVAPDAAYRVAVLLREAHAGRGVRQHVNDESQGLSTISETSVHDCGTISDNSPQSIPTNKQTTVSSSTICIEQGVVDGVIPGAPADCEDVSDSESSVSTVFNESGHSDVQRHDQLAVESPSSPQDNTHERCITEGSAEDSQGDQTSADHAQSQSQYTAHNTTDEVVAGLIEVDLTSQSCNTTDETAMDGSRECTGDNSAVCSLLNNGILEASDSESRSSLITAEDSVSKKRRIDCSSSPRHQMSSQPQAVSRRKSKRKTGGRAAVARRRYTMEDDLRILAFFEERPQRLLETRGSTIWWDLEKMMKTRTWQSLRERFLNYIVRDIESYHITNELFLKQIIRCHPK